MGASSRTCRITRLRPPGAPRTLYVCNDVGVYTSDDEGLTWKSLTRNLPRVMVVDLAGITPATACSWPPPMQKHRQAEGRVARRYQSVRLRNQPLRRARLPFASPMRCSTRAMGAVAGDSPAVDSSVARGLAGV